MPDVKTLITRASIMKAQAQDLAQKFAAFEAELIAVAHAEQERIAKDRQAA